MSSYSKCRFCGNVDYATFPEPRMCGQCSISYLAGEEDAEERIIKLLEVCPKDKKWHLDNLMCCEGRCDFAIQDYQDRIIAIIESGKWAGDSLKEDIENLKQLIKGESK